MSVYLLHQTLRQLSGTELHVRWMAAAMRESWCNAGILADGKGVMRKCKISSSRLPLAPFPRNAFAAGTPQTKSGVDTTMQLLAQAECRSLV
eukprot:5464913-Amphidinium_carterae.1